MRPVTQIALMEYGSHLYGSTLPGSDRDYAAVHLPSARGILIGRPETVLHHGTKAALPAGDGGIGSRRIRATRPDEIDSESYALGKLFEMLRGGHMRAVEMLFVPESSLITVAPIWQDVLAHRPQLISRNCKRFVGYARSQAEMYGRKATRLTDAQALQGFLTRAISAHGPERTLAEIATEIDTVVADREHLAVVPHDCGYTPDMPHLEVVGKRIAFTARLSTALGIVDSQVRRYGQRTQAAQDGTDWKSVAHAVRVAHQAIEVLTTGHISFPRPEAATLRAIRRGEHDRTAVGHEIDRLLDEVDRAAANSDLPDEPDAATMDNLLYAAHAHQMSP